MMRIIVLALCVFGTINAASINVASNENDLNVDKEISHIVSIVMKALPTKSKESLKIYLEAIPDFENVTFDNEVSQENEINESAMEKMFQDTLDYIQTLVDENNRQIVKREINEHEDVDHLIMTFHDSASTSEKSSKSSKLDKIRKILKNIGNGFDYLSNMVKEGVVKSTVKKVCKLIGHPIMDNEVESDDVELDANVDKGVLNEEKTNKSLGDKLCRQKSIDQIASAIKAGQTATSALSKMLNEKNFDQLKKILKLFKKKKN